INTYKNTHYTLLVCVVNSPKLHLITGVPHLTNTHKLLLDAPHAHKPAQQRPTPSLVIGATAASTAKRLLAHNSTRALAVEVKVSARIPEPLLGLAQNRPVLRKHRASQSIPATRLVRLHNHVVKLRVGVDVHRQD